MLAGSIFYVCGIICEAIRLPVVERLPSDTEFKMDPLVSLYCFAPACVITNGVICPVTELPEMTMADIKRVGLITLILKAFVAFALKMSGAMLVRIYSNRS